MEKKLPEYEDFQFHQSQNQLKELELDLPNLSSKIVKF